MNLKENERLKEIKLSMYINHIDKAKDKLLYSRLMKLLSCLVATLGRDAHDTFSKIVEYSIGENFLKASPKELVATCRTFFSNKKAAEKIGITNSSFYNRYRDLLDRDFITEEFVESLHPMFETQEEQFVIDFLLSFIENFKYDVGHYDAELKDKERTLEIEFWLIYDKVMGILQNSIVFDKFIFNICNIFEIDYGSIAHLKNSIHLIDRSYPNFRYNNRYFMQELVYLYTKKGLNKSAISSRVLGKDFSFLYRGTNKKYNDLIDSDNVEWQYVPTLDWEHIQRGDVMKFIELFHSWVMYNV